MGCVSSSLLNEDDELRHLGSTTALGHHIVSLTSTTYGLLKLDNDKDDDDDDDDNDSNNNNYYNNNSNNNNNDNDPPTAPPPPPASRFTLGSGPTNSPTPPDVINSWELMDGLDSIDSFRFSPLPLSHSKPSTPKLFSSTLSISKSKSKLHFHAQQDAENINPNLQPATATIPPERERCSGRILMPRQIVVCDSLRRWSSAANYSLEEFDELCPPNGDNKAVLYTTTLRGVRRTFEACNAVRSAIQGLGFSVCERDISMDRGFRDELNLLLKHTKAKEKNCSFSTSSSVAPPRLFIKGRYVGGAEEVLRMHEEGGLAQLLQGLPKLNPGLLCDGCGGFGFLPCFQCHGSCKLIMFANAKPADTACINKRQQSSTFVMRCPDCNENGLVLCPLCT